MTKVKEAKAQKAVKTAQVKTAVLEKYVDVTELKLVDGKTINTDELSKAFYALTLDADKANKGSKRTAAAGRRFRLNTTALSKAFLELRKLTPKAKSAK
jgi:hypothetical protein